jgi:hypothetical protein
MTMLEKMRLKVLSMDQWAFLHRSELREILKTRLFSTDQASKETAPLSGIPLRRRLEEHFLELFPDVYALSTVCNVIGLTRMRYSQSSSRTPTQGYLFQELAIILVTEISRL